MYVVYVNHRSLVTPTITKVVQGCSRITGTSHLIHCLSSATSSNFHTVRRGHYSVIMMSCKHLLLALPSVCAFQCLTGKCRYRTAGFICEVLISAKFARFSSVATLLPPACSYSHVNFDQQQSMLY